MSESDLCTCGELDSPEHVLKNCIKYETIRSKLKNRIKCVTLDERQLLETKEKFFAFEIFCKEILVAKELTESIEADEKPPVET